MLNLALAEPLVEGEVRNLNANSPPPWNLVTRFVQDKHEHLKGIKWRRVFHVVEKQQIKDHSRHAVYNVECE